MRAVQNETCSREDARVLESREVNGCPLQMNIASPQRSWTRGETGAFFSLSLSALKCRWGRGSRRRVDS